MYSFDFNLFYDTILSPYLTGETKRLLSEEEVLFDRKLNEGPYSWYAVSLSKLQRYQGPSLATAPKDSLVPIALELVSVVFSMLKYGATLPVNSLAYQVSMFKGDIPGLMLKETSSSPLHRKKSILIMDGTTLQVNHYSSAITLIAGTPDNTEVIAVNMHTPCMQDMYLQYLEYQKSQPD